MKSAKLHKIRGTFNKYFGIVNIERYKKTTADITNLVERNTTYMQNNYF